MNVETMGGILEVENNGPVTVVRLTNPPLNLLTVAFFEQFSSTLRRLSDDPEVRALVVTGYEGGPFSAGSDMKEFPSLRDEALVRKVLPENFALACLERLPVPTIAAIEQFALGGGLELALACDLRVAGEDSRLALPEARIGGLASNGAQRLAALVGPAVASQMLFLAEEMDAPAAQRVGLVNWVVESGTAAEFAVEIGRRASQNSRGSIQRAKHLIRRSTFLPLDRFLESALAQAETFEDADLAEGVAAFFEKRAPRFSAESR